MASITRAYRAGPIAESVRVTIQRGDEVREDTLTVRVLSPATTGHAMLRLELGPLRISAATDSITGQIIAQHVRDTTAYASWRFEGPLTPTTLARYIPPVPAPQLALALGDPSADLIPQAPAITWHGATRERLAGRSIVRLTGRSRNRPVTLRADATSGRLIDLTAMIGSDDPPTRLTLTCTPIDPGAPELWLLSTAGRQRLASLAQLSPRPVPIRPGEPFPLPILLDRRAQPWLIERALASSPRTGRRPETPLAALVFFDAHDADTLDATLAEARTGLDAIGLAQQELTARANAAIEQGGRATLVRFHPLPVALIALAQARQQRTRVFEATDRAWPDEQADRVCWSPSIGLTLDRIAPGARTVLALVDASGTLVDVIPLDGRPDAQAIADELVDRAQRQAWQLAPGTGP